MLHFFPVPVPVPVPVPEKPNLRLQLYDQVLYHVPIMKNLFLIFLIIVPFLSFAAGPIEHAFLSKMLFEKHPKYTCEERHAFIVGTLFPDIRYLGEAARHETHYHEMSLEEVLREPSPFLAGVKFHSYVDIERENFIRSHGIYHKIQFLSPENTCTFLKFLEDEIIYHQSSWHECSLALQTIYPEEYNWGMEEKSLTMWHKMLTALFATSPNQMFSMLHLMGQGVLHISAQEVTEWNHLMKPTAYSDDFQDYMEKLISFFDKKLSEQTSN
jgi:hypothetical protein